MGSPVSKMPSLQCQVRFSPASKFPSLKITREMTEKGPFYIEKRVITPALEGAFL